MPRCKVGIGTPVPTLVTGALAYLVALVAALVVIVSAVLAVLTADTGASTDPTGGAAAPATDDAGFAGIIGLLGIPFQLVALASFGSYDAELQMGFFGTMTLSWRGSPLLITVAMTAVAFLAARLPSGAGARTGRSAPRCGPVSRASASPCSPCSPRA